MVLKFCSNVFSSEMFGLGPGTGTPPKSIVLSMKNSTDDIVKKREVLTHVLLSTNDAKWEKEFRVHFDGSNSTGLGFQSLEAAARLTRSLRRSSDSVVTTVASRASETSEANATQGDDYACVVREVLPDGLAAQYNARCRSLGDYSRLVLPGLRVRKVNNDDVAGLSYSQVLQK